MPDFTICTNHDCPIENYCGRHTCEPNKFYQSYQKFEPKINDGINLSCDYFIKIDNNANTPQT